MNNHLSSIFQIPGASYAHRFSQYDWQYPTHSNRISCLAMNNESCIWSKGKVLGGSSSINSMFYIRGNPSDYNEWGQAGNTDWDWEHLLPYFMKSENFQGDNKYDMHGLDGPMTVGPFQSSRYDQLMIMQAAEQMGYPSVEDFVDGHYLGFGNIYGTVEDGRRVSTAKAFLVDDKPNLHIIKNAVAKKLHFDPSKQVTSLSFVYNGKHEMNVKANREIILSAGSIETPKLLMLSGLGPKTHLQALDIPVMVELPVGENLQDHPCAILFWKFEYKYKVSPELRTLDTIYKQWVHRTGKYGIGPLDIGAFLNTKGASEYPDLQFIYTPIDNITEFGANFKKPILQSLEQQINPGDYVIAVHVICLRPKSRGFVRLASLDYRDHPEIFPNTFQKDADMDAIIYGIRKQYEFLDSKIFQKHSAGIIRVDLPACDLHRFKTTKYWECYVKYMSNSVFDAVGTAKMGHRRDLMAVVDPELKVRGTKGLRVVDASVMPSIVSANTNAATIMIAEKGSDLIKRTWGVL